MTGRYFEEFTEYETIDHARRRTVSEADNQRFCDVTMNQQPLHLDAEFAGETEFGERGTTTSSTRGRWFTATRSGRSRR